MTYTFKIWILIFIVSSTISCNYSKDKDTVSSQKTLKETLPKAPLLYDVYIPKDSNFTNGIIVILDPHSKPQLIMDSLHTYADNNHMALIGIKDVENGVRDYISIIDRDLTHFISTSKTSRNKIYLIGFSGAARMAEYFAYSHKINGLIMCGAGMNRKNQLPFPTVLIAGIKDFNFLEQYYDLDDKLSLNKNLISFVFNGPHQWPPVSYISVGINFLIHRGKGGDDNLSSHYENQSEKYFANNNYYYAVKAMEIAYKFKSYGSDKDILNKFEILKKNKKIKNYYRRTDMFLEEELNRYKDLTRNIDVQKLKWWKNQINYINSRSNKKDPISASSYARTKAYIGLVTFSKINLSLSGKENAESLDKYISIYELLEPESPYLHFFKAVLLYRIGNELQAKDEMNIAKSKDFDDDKMLKQYFDYNFITSLNI